MSGAERRENLKNYSVSELYDFKKSLSVKLEEIKVDIDRNREMVAKMREEITALVNSKKNKQASRRKIVSEIKRRREERINARNGQD